MARKPSKRHTTIDRLVGKIVRTAAHFLEIFGFELVKVKPSGSRTASLKIIKPAAAGDKAKPVLHANPQTNKYFTVNVGCEAGVNHMKSALSLLIKESLALKRTPVVFTPRLLSSHNFGKEVDASWDKYIDLSKIAIIRNGVTHHVKVVAKDAIPDVGASTALEVKGKHLVTAAENMEYGLIIKNNPSGLGLDNVYGHEEFDFDVEFCPSAAVLDHADKICQHLGEYHSMHVRRGDKLTDKVACPNLEQDTRPEKIYETVSRILDKGSRVYVLTDEKASNYFDVLKRDYEIFQYFNFPELKRLVEGDCPDNFFLYEIEQQIFARAKTRIHTFAHPNAEPRISLTTDLGWT
jgi:hypothetical protein